MPTTRPPGNQPAKPRPQALTVQNNATQTSLARYGNPYAVSDNSQQDVSATFARNKETNEALWAKRFTDLVRPVDGRWIDANQLPIRPPCQLGRDHYTPLPTRIVPYFGLATGGGKDPFGWPRYRTGYSAYGA